MDLYSSCAVSLVGKVLNGISIQCWLLICNYPKISNSEILIAEESLTILPLFIFGLITTKAVCYYIKFLCNLSSPCPVPWFFSFPFLSFRERNWNNVSLLAQDGIDLAGILMSLSPGAETADGSHHTWLIFQVFYLFGFCYGHYYFLPSANMGLICFSMSSFLRTETEVIHLKSFVVFFFMSIFSSRKYS